MALQVSAVQFNRGQLRIELTDVSTLVLVGIVSFASVIGYRVLDERDLQSFWPACSSKHGWLYEIHANGWLQDELERPGTCMEFYGTPREYLIPGIEFCVSVISDDEPGCQLLLP